MKRTVIALLVALVAVPAFAGCLGGDDVDTKDDDGICGQDDPSCQVGGEIDEGFGGIEGKIIDDTFNPIEGANVTLRLAPGDSITTKTNKAGQYAFNNVEPGTYTVYAQNPPTHGAQGRDVRVEVDKVSPVDLILPLLPPPAKPYYNELPLAGLIGCSVSYSQIQLRDMCGEEGLGIDDRAETSITWEVYAHLTTLVVRLESEGGASPLGDPEFQVEFVRPAKASLEKMAGPVPLQESYEINEDSYSEWDVDGKEFEVSVRANGDAETPQVAYQQAFYLYLGMFYNGLPVPTDYNPRGDG